MLSNYRIDKIKSLLMDFSKVTGQRVGLFDAEFNEVFITTKNCNFCSIMRSSSKGLCGCIESDCAAMEEAKRRRAPYIYRCHAGIVEVCAPIYDDNELMGFIFLGQMLYNNNIEEQCANIELLTNEIVDDISLLRNSVYEIKRIDKDYLISSTNIMVACARYIIYEQLLKYEKSDVWYKINDYIKNNYDKKITLSKISEVISVSVPTLCKVAKEHSNKTIGELITEARIEKAKHYLESTSFSISEIANKVGIDDYSYFSRLFKKSTGYSPNSWRKTIAKMKS